MMMSEHPTFFLFQLPAMILLWLVVGLGPFSGVLWLGYYFISLPLRRQERARFFLDLVGTGLKDGRRLEDIITSLARSRDHSLGVHFHLLAAYLEKGLSLREALEKVPHLLPAPIHAMLLAGMQIGDISKVFPACHKLSKDAVSQTRGAINYLVLAAFVGFPTSLVMLSVLQIYILPQVMAVVSGMDIEPSIGLILLTRYRLAFFAIQLLLVLIIACAAFVYVDVPRFFPQIERSLKPFMDRIAYLFPWKRKRMQRNFSTMLAILLDADMPESEALTISGRCAANGIFERRVARASAALHEGMNLTEAVQLVDDHGEFRWRLTQAMRTHAGFFQAIRGWTESLDAKAFQEEQATAQVVTTTLVLVNGLIVGFVMVSVFSVLVSLINAGVLW